MAAACPDECGASVSGDLMRTMALGPKPRTSSLSPRGTIGLQNQDVFRLS